MCESEMCPCRNDVIGFLEEFINLWEANYSVHEEAKVYKDPAVKQRMDELGWDVQP